ncbi:MAG TPA: arsenite methyltransferase [Polyangia bacterium]|nr:arsenite methyltransferase [Polyangia bacterium]
MDDRDHDEIRARVRTAYAKVALGAGGCQGRSEGRSVGCCGTEGAGSLVLGYTPDDLASAPEGADLGLGCGNPQAIAALRPGDTVLDLGSGAGFDCFLAAARVGAGGRVIGVDMTPEMVSKARENARRARAANVEFRLGEIEHLPVADASIDVIISNCVINLAPDKSAVFREAIRVLKAGGRLAVSDVVATRALPPQLATSVEARTGCVAGAARVDDLRARLVEVGFESVKIAPRDDSRAILGRCLPGAEDYLASATVEARKPDPAPCCPPACCT